MPWNWSYGLVVYRGALLSFLHSCKQIFVNEYLYKDSKVFCVVLHLCQKSASPFFSEVSNGCLCQQPFYSPDHYQFVFEVRKFSYKAGEQELEVNPMFVADKFHSVWQLWQQKLVIELEVPAVTAVYNWEADWEWQVKALEKRSKKGCFSTRGTRLLSNFWSVSEKRGVFWRLRC